MSHASRRIRYVLKRLLQAVPIVLAIVILNFFLLQLAEGDAVDVLAGEAGSATPEYMAELRAKFGLDQPLEKILEHEGDISRARLVAKRARADVGAVAFGD
ncbi:MAG: hypothetical protein AAFU55_00230, partial [Pseudomonadota bacterium]